MSDINAIHGNVQGYGMILVPQFMFPMFFSRLMKMSLMNMRFRWEMKANPKCLAKGMWNFFFTSRRKIILAKFFMFAI